MARLRNTEKRQLVAATTLRSVKPVPPLRLLSPRAYLEFATFASRFNRAPKPVRFVGDGWKL